jgi:hypothetical protein
MIDHSHCRIDSVAVHSVGNTSRNEGLLLSKSLLDISDTTVRDLLKTFFLTPFDMPEFHAFTFTNGDFALNPMFNFVGHIFDHEDSLHQHSIDIAKHLYDTSVHPQIKSGDLFVVKFSNLRFKDVMMDAIGIFKSENRQSFLKLDAHDRVFSIRSDEGINIDKLDKGCLILDIDQDTGYKVCAIDKSNRSTEAQYWKDDFLNLKPCADDYYHTKVYMNITKSFVTDQLAEDFDVNKADQIDLLNRSVKFFKSRETFDKNEFEDEVLQETGVINSFRNYHDKYSQDHDIDATDTFDISPLAIKKQARVFKSVLKLDKNFHIYIHGDRNLIEQGMESDGRKFYKIYFQQEA